MLVADGQGSDAKTKRLVDEIRKITRSRSSTWSSAADHADHVGGNAAFPAGTTFIAHPASKAAVERIVASGRKIPVPQETVADKRVLKMGATEIQILFLGRAHTGGDLQVFLPRENILFMGEAFFNRLYPSVGGNRSAYPIEWIDTIKKAEAMNAAIYVPDHDS